MNEQIHKSELANTSSDSVPILTEGIGTRISEMANAIGSRKYAAKVAGVSPDSLQRYIREEVQPTFEVMARMAKASGKSLDWLANLEKESDDKASPTKEKSIPLESDDFAYIPLLNVEVSTGHGSLNGAEKSKQLIAFRKDYLHEKGLIINKLAAVKARGDSMVPEIADGSTLLVDTSKSKPEDGVYVLRMDENLYAKRLQIEFNGSVRIISANSLYREQLVRKEDRDQLHILGRVVWSDREH